MLTCSPLQEELSKFCGFSLQPWYKRSVMTKLSLKWYFNWSFHFAWLHLWICTLNIKGIILVNSCTLVCECSLHLFMQLDYNRGFENKGLGVSVQVLGVCGLVFVQVSVCTCPLHICWDWLGRSSLSSGKLCLILTYPDHSILTQE